MNTFDLHWLAVGFTIQPSKRLASEKYLNLCDTEKKHFHC